MLAHIKINNFEYVEDNSQTILQVAAKHGIKIPTLCYIKKEECNFEHKPASCRVCIVEVKGRNNLLPACSTYIADKMEIYTNNIRVRAERKAVLELMLSNHPNDCLTCAKSDRCSLQALAAELGIKRRKYVGPLSQPNEELVYGSIVRNPSKCILCTRCSDLCDKVQSIGAITPSERGFRTIISEPVDCVNCGQCVQVCPTGALMQVDDTRIVDRELNDPDKYVIVNTAPSVRVSLGEPFGLEPGTDVTGKMITALRMLGFKKVFDTNFSADLTIMEEATELIERLKEGKKLPIITSCCPGWIKFIETQYPELLHLPSSCKSPQEMFGAIAKTYFAKQEGIDPKKIVNVSLMPCIAKKQELARDEEKFDGLQGTDYSLSVKEFAMMLKRYGIDLVTLPDSEFDSPLGKSTGAADIFGHTGGVMEAALRSAAYFLKCEPPVIEFHGVIGKKNTKEALVQLDDVTLRVCVVSGLANARIVLDELKAGKSNYDAIEIMACPGGCVNGGGQFVHKHRANADVIKGRTQGLKDIDKGKSIRISAENEEIIALYDNFLGKPGSELAHHLLHTSYKDCKNEE